MRRIVKTVLICLMLSVGATACFADSTVDTVRKAVTTILPAGTKIDSIRPSAISGVYEVQYGSEIIYVHANGRYAFTGDMIDLEKRSNLTEKMRSKNRQQQLSQTSDDETVVFAPKKTLHTVTVFTDIDCGYCRKMHGEMSSYHAQGIRIRYVAFPRAGVSSESARKLVSVWCAKNPQDAMNRMMAGKDVESKTCNNPVTKQYNLGRALGVSGTPSIVLESGEIVPGYVPAERLRALLDGK